MEESLIDVVQRAITDFRSGWFLGCSTLCYVLVNVWRGKAGFQIPYLTPWIEKQPKEAKTYIVLLLFAFIGFFTAFSAQKVTFAVVFNGFLQGLGYGVGAIGARSAIKQGIEGTQSYLANKKTDDKPGSETK
jgi:uncharacterized membrane-anchored protein YitT (DUF2179 family)